MLTKNFYVLLAVGCTYESERKSVPLTGWNGADNKYYNWYNSGPQIHIKSAMQTVATSAPRDTVAFTQVMFGTGDTPPTINDYNLSGDFIAGLVATQVTTNLINSDSLSISALYTLINSNAEAVTIKEVGLGQSFFYYNSGQNSCLLDRTVLDTPVTIPAGGVGQVEYTITFNLPTAAADADGTE